MPISKPITILLVDDHEIIRSGLKALLCNEVDFRVVGEAANGHAAIEQLRLLSPNVVVMDLGMPDLNGIDATRQLVSLMPSVKVIGLSALGNERSAGEMHRAGAAGFVSKVSAYEELKCAIRTVVTGNSYFSPSVLEGINIRGNGAVASAFTLLSPREREVLQLISEGKATKEVAMHLKVSLKTAETHRRNLMEKLNIGSVAELTKYAIREGLTAA